MTFTPRLVDIKSCFQGVIPSVVATADHNRIPNVTYVSQVFLIDESHVALSCQFFNKTRRNLQSNPRASVEVYDPLTMQAYKLRLRFLRSETSGELFSSMEIRIDAIASLTGMSGIFKLIAADVFEVESLNRVEGFLVDSPGSEAGALSLDGFRTELRGLQCISERISRACDLESLFTRVLEALEEYYNFHHTMVLLVEDGGERLVAMASRGYGSSGVGAEVVPGEGLIGTVAREKRVLRMSGLDAGLRYGRAARRESVTASDGRVGPEIPLPGLIDAQSALVIPLLVVDRLIGVLAAESREAVGFGEWHEAYLEVVGNQIALGIDRMLSKAEDDEDLSEREALSATALSPKSPTRSLTYYRSDDCLFLDGDYLIRNVPGRILWKLLSEWSRDGRTAFTNRELRLDPALGLPPVKDNLESRLILLRSRLAERAPEIRIRPTGRGRFALDVETSLELIER